jgi:hypothetical protein
MPAKCGVGIGTSIALVRVAASPSPRRAGTLDTVRPHAGSEHTEPDWQGPIYKIFRDAGPGASAIAAPRLRGHGAGLRACSWIAQVRREAGPGYPGGRSRAGAGGPPSALSSQPYREHVGRRTGGWASVKRDCGAGRCCDGSGILRSVKDPAARSVRSVGDRGVKRQAN